MQNIIVHHKGSKLLGGKMLIWNAEACGNKFLVTLGTQSSAQSFVKIILRNKKWNFDSILVLTTDSHIASARMTVWEKDGSQSVMCGNGLRVAGQIITKLGMKPIIEANNKALKVKPAGDGQGFRAFVGQVMHMGIYQSMIKAQLPTFNLYTVGGEPHIVTLVPDAKKAPLHIWGPMLAGPVNCTVASYHGNGKIQARTFERGVNAETLSCGTGACAAVFAVKNFGYEKTDYEVNMNGFKLGVYLQGVFAMLEGSVMSEKIAGRQSA